MKPVPAAKNVGTTDLQGPRSGLLLSGPLLGRLGILVKSEQGADHDEL